MRGWRWWGYITAEALTLFIIGLLLVLDTVDSDVFGVGKLTAIGVGLMIGGIVRFIKGARNKRAKFD